MQQSDVSPVNVNVKQWKVEKFDGEKQPGDGKTPVEIIVGGEDEPTRVLMPDHPDFASFVTKEK